MKMRNKPTADDFAALRSEVAELRRTVQYLDAKVDQVALQHCDLADSLS